MRKRPPNRLVTQCVKVKDKESGFVVYLHIDRAMLGDRLGPVLGVAFTPKTKTGSGLDSLFAEITRVLNREIQVQEVT
jgi:hypothetical protein